MAETGERTVYFTSRWGVARGKHSFSRDFGTGACMFRR